LIYFDGEGDLKGDLNIYLLREFLLISRMNEKRWIVLFLILIRAFKIFFNLIPQTTI